VRKAQKTCASAYTPQLLLNTVKGLTHMQQMACQLTMAASIKQCIMRPSSSSKNRATHVSCPGLLHCLHPAPYYDSIRHHATQHAIHLHCHALVCLGQLHGLLPAQVLLVHKRSQPPELQQLVALQLAGKANLQEYNVSDTVMTTNHENIGVIQVNSKTPVQAMG
jgi:hypothetical protein